MQLWDKIRANPYAWGGLGAVVILLLVLFMTPRARAESLPKADNSPLSFLPISDVAKAGSWSGLGVGVYGSWVNADTDTSPFTFGSTGFTGGASISASLQMGVMVVEGFGEYGWFFGDLQDIGANTEMAAGARLGILANQETLVYLVGAKSWIDTDGGTIDGWQYGGGVKLRLKSTPTFLTLEYRHGQYDASSVVPVDLATDTVRLGVTLQFGPK